MARKTTTLTKLSQKQVDNLLSIVNDLQYSARNLVKFVQRNEKEIDRLLEVDVIDDEVDELILSSAQLADDIVNSDGEYILREKFLKRADKKNSKRT